MGQDKAAKIQAIMRELGDPDSEISRELKRLTEKHLALAQPFIDQIEESARITAEDLAIVINARAY